MATGTILPWITEQFFDNNGNPLASGTVDFYVAGTTTRQNTYSDAALTTANANPVVLDSAGRATIYLDPSLTYKAVISTSLGALVRTADNILPQGFASGTCCEGRLTLTTGTPVSADVTGGNTLYFTPYKGNRISLYNGTTWVTLAFVETSITLVGLTAAKNYDVWGYLNASGALQLELLVWTNDSTRGTAITLSSGIYVKSGDVTRRYLGTIRTTAGGSAVDDTVTVRGVWNYYNRVPRRVIATDATDSWTYTTATIRQANNSTANQVAAVIGVSNEAEVDVEVVATAANTNASVGVMVTVGRDATNAAASGALMNVVETAIANGRVALRSRLVDLPPAGYHFYTWLEYSLAVGTTTWYGDGGAPTLLQSGLTGTILG